MVDLNQIGVIVTRPQGQSTHLIERITQHHGTAFEVPCLTIADVADKRKARNRIKQAKNYDYLLFTSPNSVTYGVKLGLSLEGDFGLIAIGTGTRSALLEHCDRDIIQAPKPYTSEALIEKLGEVALKDKKILIISGEGGRRILGDSLRDDYGAKTEYVDVYRREVPHQFNIEAALAHRDAGLPLVLFISSQEALNNIDPTLTESGLKDRLNALIVGSERLKSYAESLNYQSIIVAASALEDDMWEALSAKSDQLRQTIDPSTKDDNKKESEDDDEAFTFTLGDSGDALIDDEQSAEEAKKDEGQQSHQPETTDIQLDDITLSDIESKENEASSSETASTNQPPENRDLASELDSEKSEEIVEKVENDINPNEPSVVVKKSGSAISWLALLIALGAGGLSGYQYYESLNSTTSESDEVANIAQLKADLQSTQARYDQLAAQVKKMPQSIPPFPVSSAEIADLKNQMDKLSKVDQLDQSITQLSTQYQKRIDALESGNNRLNEQLSQLKETTQSLNSKINAQNDLVTDSSELAQKADDLASSFEARLEEELSKQRAIVTEADSLVKSLKNSTDVEALRLTEIEYLLNFAAYKLTFETDLPSVAYALKEAKTRLESVSSLNVSETLKRLNPALEQINHLLENPINIEQYASQLIKAESLVSQASLAEELIASEFRTALKEQAQSKEEKAETEERHWYNDLADTLSPLFIVQKRRIDDPLFISDEDARMIQQNILLQLSTARLAILQGQTTAFKESITQARQWLDQYYDHSDDYTNDAIALLDQLLEVKTAYAEDELPNLDPIRSIYRATRNVNSEGELQ